jgi:arylsulfatase A-like enzyme
VLILLFDTLSARHLPLHDYSRNTTPNLVRFAERATVFHQHYAAGNFTSPGTASIFTGTYPWTHRAFNLRGTVSSDFERRNFFSLLPADVFSLAYSHNLLPVFLFQQFQEDLDMLIQTRELSLVDNQYSDLIFPKDYNASFWSEEVMLRNESSQPASLFSSLVYRVLRLLNKQEVVEDYGSLFPRGIPNNFDIYYILEDAMDWMIAELAALPQPNLVYFHFMPPHEPYSPRREFIGLFDDGYVPVSKPASKFSQDKDVSLLLQRRREYDEYIAYVDSEFGRLIDHLEREGVLDDTLVIFTSDHGELFERGILGHTTETLYEPLIRVPLIISKPEQTQRQDVFTPTSCVDLLPTLQHFYHREIPAWCEGEILPTFGDQQGRDDRSVYAVETRRNSKYAALSTGTIALIKNRYKLIHYFGYEDAENEYELFNLANDPEELEDLYPLEKAIATALQNELMTKLDEVNQAYK